ncbi:MAG: FAD-dependent oxidoreductase [Oscillospiraceae bacterium]|jgi:2,4-dienoyl-CoA reductase-like NADH-dependent reductase (Old Yellow Enzyme family)/thioredoxin reductase|nr:FAD-dependent oxidoreductase [Oscillospiraceae bacterium]
MYEIKYPHLFSPITLAGTTFRNRIFGSPTGSAHLTTRYFPIQETNAYYERKALGGAASVCVGDCVVDSEHGRFNFGHIALDHPDIFPSLYNLADSISRHGAVASIELSHSGSHAHSSAAAGNQLYGPMEYTTENGFHVEAMTEEVIFQTIDKFAKAAATAKRSGFGMVTIHGGHGWLITEFMSPISNRRTDRWGGSPENRCRLAVEICKAIRREVGPNFPIEMRISGSECNPGGYDIDEGIEIAKQLDGHLDLIHVSAGSHEVWDVFTVTHPDMFLPDGVNVKYAAEIKKHVKQSKVATVGALSDPALMEEIIASGQADIVELARGLIADPDLPNKARAGRDGDIKKCMRCLACFSNLMAHGQFCCAINPVIGHEIENKWTVQPAKKKKILIAGGGIAGMQAAITASERGHEVVLCEKTAKLGGALKCEDGVSFKKNLGEYLEIQAKAVEKSGVQVRLNTEVTPELAKKEAPDVIIAALGARPVKPRIQGIDGANVVGAEEVYYDAEKAKGDVVILGGGLVGAELAIHLARSGKKVKVIEMLDYINDGGNTLQGLAIRLELARRGVEMNLSTKALEITDKGVIAETKDGAQKLFAADTIVYAVGQRPLADEAEALRFLAPEYHRIGDCLAPRNIVEATKAAYNITRDIGRFV